MPKTVTDDSRLSWEARGLLQYILAKPDNWNVRTTDLINQTRDSLRPTGRDGVLGLIDELEFHGYLARDAKRSEGGTFAGVNYVAYEEPLPVSELAEVRQRWAEKQAKRDQKAQALREKRASKSGNKAKRPETAQANAGEMPGSEQQPQPCVPDTVAPNTDDTALNKYLEATNTEKPLNTEYCAGPAGAEPDARVVEGELLDSDGAPESGVAAGFKQVTLKARLPGYPSLTYVVPKSYPVDPKGKCFRTWYAYAVAHHEEYGVWPLLNQRVSGMVAQFIDRVGAELAPRLAKWYVMSVREKAVTESCHSVELLLKRAESYSTQFQSGRIITSQEARNIERTAANLNTLQQLNGQAPVPPSDEYSRVLAELNGGA